MTHAYDGGWGRIKRDPVPSQRPRIRPRWWIELSIVACGYAFYSVTRMLMPHRTGAAFAHAVGLLHVERAWHLAPEIGLNALVSSHRVLAVILDYHYATLHYIVTPAVLIWLVIARPDRYRHARRILLVATIIGLIGFWLAPVAPPRMLGDADGFVDTMARFAMYGWWSHDASAPRGLGGLTNEYAAMPSLHVGWALWCGWQVASYAKHRWVRIAGVLYPITTIFAVMGTGNHYFLDVVGGVAVMLVAVLVVKYGEKVGRWALESLGYTRGQARGSPAVHVDQERFQSA
ncbi:MAG: phosphatase PAP2 family protein [Actinomycetes bacterium]